MAEHRVPLGSIPLNTPLPASHSHSSSPGASSSSSATRKLAPIFLTKKRTPTSTSTSTSAHESSLTRKRPRIEPLVFQHQPEDEGQEREREPREPRSHGGGRVSSIPEWFLPSTPLAYERVNSSTKYGKRKIVVDDDVADVVVDEVPGVWRRGRRRLGIASRPSTMLDTAHRYIPPQDPYLSTLVTSIAPYNPLALPSILLLPSLHPPTGRPREFAPALSLAFNNIAKHWDASSARAAGHRRLIAVAGEEGGVRIVDVDEGLGAHREEKGFWWRAHGNAIFDFKWSSDDQRVLSASGDQSTRIHALSSPTPTLTATLRGHTSSVKTAVFFDPSRSHSDPSTASSVVATGGRDGNILIYDVRCQGRPTRESESPSPSRSQSRDRYSAGVPGFTAEHSASCLDPVMIIKQAHGDGKRGGGRTSVRSVTSLVALQSMPGVLASGGSFDGIVKLWDLRFTEPTSRHPEGRGTCSAYGSLPDPTLLCANPSRRPRSINAMCEQPTTGDLFALCGDSRVHTLRPSAASANPEIETPEAILPKTYSDPNLLVSSFYIRLAISPDGRYMSGGSCRGGVMTWDLEAKGDENGSVGATRLRMGAGGVAWPPTKEREVCAVDWGKDMVSDYYQLCGHHDIRLTKMRDQLAASSDDLATRIWRSNPQAARWLRDDPTTAGEEWLGTA